MCESSRGSHCLSRSGSGKPAGSETQGLSGSSHRPSWFPFHPPKKGAFKVPQPRTTPGAHSKGERPNRKQAGGCLCFQTKHISLPKSVEEHGRRAHLSPLRGGRAIGLVYVRIWHAVGNSKRSLGCFSNESGALSTQLPCRCSNQRCLHT